MGAFWSARQESNLHARGQEGLSLPGLPFPHTRPVAIPGGIEPPMTASARQRLSAWLRDRRTRVSPGRVPAGSRSDQRVPARTPRAVTCGRYPASLRVGHTSPAADRARLAEGQGLEP